MGFDDLVDCSSFVSSAIGRMGYSVKEASHAMSELSKAVEVYNSSSSSKSFVKPSTVVKMSIVREPLIKFDGTKEVTFTVDNAMINWDVLEKNFGPFNKGDIVFHK